MYNSTGSYWFIWSSFIIMLRLFRWLFLLALIAGSIYIWYIVSVRIYDLMDFQVSIYEQALQVSQQVDSAKQGLLWLFGDTTQVAKTPISAKIANFDEKLLRGSRAVGLLVGLLSRYISSTFVFGFAKMCRDVKEFVG